ncbi:hypothetical protein SpCBS45565_g07028 [Spizellomyces sp. 'palustris']|nr:hypothetical protein SpCBS45565_g07028 [Spizellomyces sp. 'palustris']
MLRYPRPQLIIRSLPRLTVFRSYASPPPFSQPGPIPLGEKEAQMEFEELVKKAEELAAKEAQEGLKHPDALEKLQGEDWEGDKNPATGEVGGPKGKEPTRFGDWERKGRVYDF